MEAQSLPNLSPTRSGAPTCYYSNILADPTSHPPPKKNSYQESHHNMTTVAKNVAEDPQSPPPTPTLTPSTAEAPYDPVYGYHPQAPSHSPFHQSPQHSAVLTSSYNVSRSVFKGTKGKQKRSSTKQTGTLPTTSRRRSRLNPS